MRLFDASDAGFEAAFGAYLREPRGSPGDVDAAVAAVIAAVRDEGLSAVLRFARQFDDVDLTEETLRVSADEIAQGAAACPAPVREALAFAGGRIRDYHERQRPADAWFTDSAGVGCWVGGGRRWRRSESMCRGDGPPTRRRC